MATYLELERQKRELLQEEADMEIEEAKKGKKMEEQKTEPVGYKEGGPVGFKEGGILQSKEEIRAEAFDDIRKAIRVLNEFPELKKLLEES